MEEALTQILKSFNYRHNRYQINYSVALWHSQAEIDLTLLSDSIRKTDTIACLDSCTYAVIFERTDTQSGIQAAKNLLETYESTFSSKPLFSTVVHTSQFENIHVMVPELITRLQVNLKKMNTDASD